MNQDMITGKPGRSLVLFALPMILGNVFQQCYTLADTIIVGRTLGQNALAAVGSTTTICLVFISIAIGLGLGCSVVISQLFGAKKFVEMKTAVFTSITTLMTLSIIFLLTAVLACDGLLTLLNTPSELLTDARSYFTIYSLGFPGLFMYNISNSCFNALGKSRTPLFLLIFSSVLNVGLDLWFIIGFKWAVAGAAIATIISQYLAAAISFALLLRYIKKNFKTDKRSVIFRFSVLKGISKVAVPTMVTQTIVSVGYVAMQSLVNSFGSDVMAGYAAATKIDGLTIIPMVQVGNANSTFAAQNIGAGKLERVAKGYHVALIMNAVISISFAVILSFVGRAFVGLFMDSDASARAIEVGAQCLSICSCFYIIMGFMNITNGLLRGAGDAAFTMISLLANFGSRVAFAYIMTAILNTELCIWWANPLGWTVGLVLAYIRYKSGHWKNKSLVKNAS